MPTVIREIKEPKAGLAFANWPVVKTYATAAQEEKINKLSKKNPGLTVVPHRQQGKHKTDALVALDDYHAVWICPKGEATPAESPNPCCYGNPTTAHCIANGYCRRSPACNE